MRFWVASESTNQGKEGEGKCSDIFEIGESEECIFITI